MENAENVYVPQPASGGAVWSAPYDKTKVPTDASTKLDEVFKSLGFIHEDGITNASETDSKDIVAYGGTTVKTVQTSYKETYKFTPIETNAVTLAVTYGDDNLTIGNDGGIAVVHNAKQKPARIYVLENMMDENTIERTVIPRGRITEVGERKYASSDPYAAELTLTCEADDAGNTAYTYFAKIKKDGE